MRTVVAPSRTVSVRADATYANPGSATAVTDA
jgi:hypothetical protein